MTQMRVPAAERGMVRLFSVALTRAELDRFATAAEGGDWPLRAALGVAYLEAGAIELFHTDDLEGLGLRGYMAEGLGIAEADLEQDAAALDRVKGPVLVVLSAAFGGQAATLAPRAPLRWIGTYAEERAPVQFRDLPSAAAKGPAPPPGPAPASGGLRVPGWFAWGLAAGGVALLIWIFRYFGGA